MLLKCITCSRSLCTIKSEFEWDEPSSFQNDINVDTSGMNLVFSYTPCQEDWDAVFGSLFLDREPSVPNGDYLDSVDNASCAQRRQNQVVYLEQVVARANDERKELEIQVAQYAAKLKHSRTNSCV